MYLIAGITLITHILCTAFFYKKYGAYSPGTLFLFSLGFFQTSRLIYIAVPSLNHFLEGEDYTLISFLLLLSIVFFTVGHEVIFRHVPAATSASTAIHRQIPADNSESTGINDDRRIFDLGKYIIWISFFPAIVVSLQSFLSSSVGAYGVDDGGITPLQKISLYASTIGLQLINASTSTLSRNYIFLIILVTVPRLLLSFVSMRGYFIFFILAQFCVLFVNGMISDKWKKTITFIFLNFIPVVIILPLAIRGGSTINELLDTLSSIIYGFSDPITLLNLANDNIHNIPKIIYSFSSVIAIYFPFLNLKDYYISAEENPLGEGVMVNRLDRALTKYLLWDRGMKFAGTGGNYIADLYVDLGFLGVLLGSLLLGRIVRLFEDKMKTSRLVLFLSFYFFQKLIYLPRGTYTELFDMLPIYAIIFMLLVFVANFFPARNVSPRL